MMNGILGLVFLIVGVPFQLVSIVLYAMLSKRKPIKNRVPELAVVSGVYVVCYFVFLAVDHKDVLGWMSILYYPIVYWSMIIRGWTVYIAWYYNEAKLSKAMECDLSEGMHHMALFNPNFEWFLTKSYMLKRWFRYSVLSVSVVVHLLLYGIKEQLMCTSTPMVNLSVHILLITLYSIASLVVVRLLRSIGTGLGIYREILSVTTCTTILQITYQILHFHDVEEATLCLLVLPLIQSVITFAMPICHATKEDNSK